MTIISLNGIKIRVKPPDLDQDGITGGVENITQRIHDHGVQPIVQPTELGESLKLINDDTLDPGTKMSGIDMRARLHHIELASILAVDTLVALRVLNVNCLNFTRQKKRLSVSLEGKGRREHVEIVAGKRELEVKQSSGLTDRVKGFFGMNKENK